MKKEKTKVTRALCGAFLTLVSGNLRATAQTPTAPGPESGWILKSKSGSSSSHPTGGVYGANRRVAIAGHVCVKGTFADPTWQLAPTTGKPGTNWEGKKINKPTFYFGVKGDPTTTEAGLQWEPDPGPPESGIRPGWVVFHRVTIDTNEGQWSLWKHTPGIERAPYQGLGQVALRYEVQPDGRVMIYMNSGQWGYQTFGPYTTSLPKDGDGSINVAAVTARRVVALTQADTATSRPAGSPGHKSMVTFDGSRVRNLHFIGGEVSRKVGVNLPEGDFASWPAAGSTEKLLPDTRIPGAPWPIDFESPSTPRNKQTGAYQTGYSAEKVRIDMSPGKTRGKRAK